MRKRRRSAVLAVFAVAASAFLLPASPASAATFDNACVNSLIPTQASLIPITMTADASPGTVAPGDSVTLSNIQQHSDIPPAVFIAGYNAGVLTTGNNNIPITNVHTVIAGTNTVEGTQVTNNQTGTATTFITDPDGTPGTGDETATPGALDVSYTNQTWHAGASGMIDFREATVIDPTAPDPPGFTNSNAGINITAVVAGIITVRFGCDPGEVVESAPPSTIVRTDPAVSFSSPSVQIVTPPPSVDATGVATMSGPLKAGATTKSYKLKVSNNGANPFTIDPTQGTGQITGSVTVNGNPNGSVVSTSTRAKTINPGRGTSFGLKWTGGPLASGDTVVFTGCVNPDPALFTEVNPADNCGSLTRTIS